MSRIDFYKLPFGVHLVDIVAPLENTAGKRTVLVGKTLKKGDKAAKLQNPLLFVVYHVKNPVGVTDIGDAVLVHAEKAEVFYIKQTVFKGGKAVYAVENLLSALFGYIDFRIDVIHRVCEGIFFAVFLKADIHSAVFDEGFFDISHIANLVKVIESG